MKSKIFALFLVLCLPLISLAKKYKPLKIGYSLHIDKINAEEMAKAKQAGVSYIEIGGWNSYIDGKSHEFKLSDDDLAKRLKEIKNIVDAAGIKIWSIHMPYSKFEDISSLNEVERQRTLATHKRIIKQAKVLEPQIILFHPSWHLGINEREERKEKLVNSAIELNKEVRNIKAKLVIENMLGPVVVRNEKQEWPLGRSVEEVVSIMGKLPKNIYAAVDMNHIKSPENLIIALGSRLKSIHIADGDGEGERHAFPCTGEWKNNWNAILGGLYKAKYKGPFMYECKIPNLESLKTCYESLYNNYISSK